MNYESVLLVLDEFDRLLAELRSISSNPARIQIQEEIVSLKLKLLTESVQFSQILSPFEKIITDEQTTDFITSLALSSINTFVSFNLLQNSQDAEKICYTIKNCQFQSTSDFDCLTVSYRILTCIISLCRTSLLNSNCLSIMLDYTITEIKNCDKNLSSFLIDALSCISSYIFRNNITFDFLSEKVLTNLYFLCQKESSFRQCGLYCLLQISRISPGRNDSLMAFTCSLFHKFISSIDSRDNFVLILRLFTHVFIDNYMLYPLPFTKCFYELLAFIESTPPNKSQQNLSIQLVTSNSHLKTAATEIIFDFLSRPNFLLNLFVNLNSRTYFPDLFDKLVKVFFLNIEKNNNFLTLILPDIKLLSIDQSNLNFLYNKDEIIQNFKSEKDHFLKLTDFSKQFNEDPSYYIKSSDYSPNQIAHYLLEAPNLSRKQIGEFFAKNKPFCMETLHEYLEFLDFSNLDFDSSIRLFLSGFQIAGEGQIVDRIFECFSKRFFACQSDRYHFKSAESVHILSYGWLMIHTSFHNNNVTKKPVFEEFLSMMANQNNGDNFDENFLREIFESVKNVKVPFEDSEQGGSVAHWRLLLCKQKLIQFKFVDFSNISKSELPFIEKNNSEINDTQSDLYSENENLSKSESQDPFENNSPKANSQGQIEKDAEPENQKTQKAINEKEQGQKDSKSEVTTPNPQNTETVQDRSIDSEIEPEANALNDEKSSEKVEMPNNDEDDIFDLDFLLDGEVKPASEPVAGTAHDSSISTPPTNNHQESQLDPTTPTTDTTMLTPTKDLTSPNNSFTSPKTDLTSPNNNFTSPVNNRSTVKDESGVCSSPGGVAACSPSKEGGIGPILLSDGPDGTVSLFLVERAVFSRVWFLEGSKITDFCIRSAGTLQSVSSLASLFGMFDIVDDFVTLVSKSAIEELLSVSPDSSSESGPLFLLGRFVREHGSSIRVPGWRSYVKLLSALFELDLLNDELLTFANVSEGMRPAVLCHRLISSKTRRSSVFSLLLGRRPSSDDLRRTSSHSNLRDTVSKSGIERFIEENSSVESLASLVAAVVEVSGEALSPSESDQKLVALCAVLIEKVLTQKKEKVALFERTLGFVSEKFFVHFLNRKSSTFLSALFLNEAFVVILELWEREELRASLVDLIEKISMSSQICEVQVDMVEKCLSLFLAKNFATFVQLQNLRGVLNLIQIGLLQNSPSSFQLFDLFNDITDGDFDGVRLPLIQTRAAVVLARSQDLNRVCSKQRGPETGGEVKTVTFSDLRPLIFNRATSAKQWAALFNDVLFPLTTRRVRRGELLALILAAFEFAAGEIRESPLFDAMWFRLLGLALEFGRACGGEERKAVEEGLGRCIRKMRELSVFSDERSKIWSLTKSNVEKVFPSII